MKRVLVRERQKKLFVFIVFVVENEVVVDKGFCVYCDPTPEKVKVTKILVCLHSQITITRSPPPSHHTR